MPSFSHDCQFQRLLAGGSQICLPGLMLEFAQDAYPGLDLMASLAELERLGSLAAARIADASGDSLRARLQALSQLLADDEGFRGNLDDYFDPRNSYLNDVLNRRLGIPLSLSVVYLAVAYRAGLRLFGVGTPGHFLIGAQENNEVLYVDPFHGGDVLDPSQCSARLEQVTGRPVEPTQFAPCSPQEMAIRTLRNLKSAYARRDDWQQVLPVQRRLTMLLPDSADERRDLGLVLLRTGAAHQAVPLLEECLRELPEKNNEVLFGYLRTARRLAAERN